MCPSGVRYCSPSVARICSRWAGSASSRSSVISPSRWPIVAGSPAPVDRYVNSSGGRTGPSPELGNQSMPSTLSWARARRWAARNGTSSVLLACSPASTMRQLAQIPFACGRQLHRHESRIRHVPTTAASPIVTAPSTPTSNTNSVRRRRSAASRRTPRCRTSGTPVAAYCGQSGRRPCENGRMTDRRAVSLGTAGPEQAECSSTTTGRFASSPSIDPSAATPSTRSTAAALLAAFVEFDADDCAVGRRADRRRRLLLRRCRPPRPVRRAIGARSPTTVRGRWARPGCSCPSR